MLNLLRYQPWKLASRTDSPSVQLHVVLNHMEFYSWRPHPWHGLEPSPKAPEIVEAYLDNKLDTFQQSPVKLEKTYGTKKAQQIIRASIEDYAAHFSSKNPAYVQ